MKFHEIDIHPKLREKASQKGFEKTTAIQKECLPLICKGRDVVGQAETGSGKTLAFALPVLDKVVPGRGLQVLALTPTRELCVQVTEVFHEFGKPLGLKAISVYGGVSINRQIKELKTADIVVGTPGRILDHLGRKTIDFINVGFLILDETDRMFDMGFIDDVEKIISHVPKERQTLMFSATVSKDVHDVMKRHLKDPLMIKTQEFVDQSKLRQVYYDIDDRRDKFSLLVHLLKNSTPGLAIVFCATRRESDLVARNLRRQRVNATAIHGGMTQNGRQRSLDALKRQKTDVLVATDVAARGLDIKNVTHVYNYDVPNTAKEYVHRIGRTARAGEDGDAVTMLTDMDHDNFRRVQSEYELDIMNEEMPDFERLPFDRGSGSRSRSSGGSGGYGRRSDSSGRGDTGRRDTGRRDDRGSKKDKRRFFGDGTKRRNPPGVVLGH